MQMIQLFIEMICFDKNYRNIQGDLNCLHKWCFTNGLTINGRKTKVVNFGNNPKKVVNKPLHINRSVLSYEKQYKYLGVILDSKLNFEAHCKEIIKTYFLLCSIYRNIKNEFLTPMVPRKMTRMHRAPILPLATPNSDWFYRSAVYFGIKTWNILPINIRNSQSLDIFKSSIKQYLFI